MLRESKRRKNSLKAKERVDKTSKMKCDVNTAFANAFSSTNDCLKEKCQYYRDGFCLIDCMETTEENKERD